MLIPNLLDSNRDVIVIILHFPLHFNLPQDHFFINPYQLVHSTFHFQFLNVINLSVSLYHYQDLYLFVHLLHFDLQIQLQIIYHQSYFLMNLIKLAIAIF